MAGEEEPSVDPLLNVSNVTVEYEVFSTNASQNMRIMFTQPLQGTEGTNIQYTLYEGNGEERIQVDQKSSNTETDPAQQEFVIEIPLRLVPDIIKNYSIQSNVSEFFSEFVYASEFTMPLLENSITSLNVDNLTGQSVFQQGSFDQSIIFQWDMPYTAAELVNNDVQLVYCIYDESEKLIPTTSPIAEILYEGTGDEVGFSHTVPIGRRLAPNTQKTYTVLLRGYTHGNIFSGFVTLQFVMDQVNDIPCIPLSLADKKCYYNADTTLARFEWNDTLGSAEYSYQIIRRLPSSGDFLQYNEEILAELTSVDSEGTTLNFETYVASSEDIESIFLREVENMNSNIYSSDINFELVTVCLLKGTLVKTQDSYVAIETLRVGDMVLNHKQEPTKITKVINIRFAYIENPVGKEVSGSIYKIPAGQYGATNDVFLTHYHKFLANGKMVRPCEAGLTRAKPEEICDENNRYSVYHLRLEDEYKNHFIVNGDCVVEDWYEWVKPTPPESRE